MRGQGRRLGISRVPARSHGVTLVELVVVCAVLALLLAVSAPRFQQTAQRLRAERAAFEFAQLLRYAHERAVADGSVMVASWDAGSRRLSVGALARPGVSPQSHGCEATPVPLSPAMTSAVVPSSLDVRLTLEDGEIPCVHFFPEGTSDAATVTVHAGSIAYTATVDETTSSVQLASGPAAR